MTSVRAVLEALNKRYGFVGSVLVTRTGRFLGRAGDFEPPYWNDPYNVLFRDAPTIANTFELMNDRSHGAMVQGECEVLVFKIRPDIVLGLVKNDRRDAMELYRVATELDGTLPGLFSAIDLDGLST